MSWRRLPHRQLNTHVLPPRVMGRTRQERWLKRTGGPVRPRQNYTYATRDVCYAARFATRSRRDDRQCWRRVDMWARLPGRSPHRPAQPHRSRAPQSWPQAAQVRRGPSSTERAWAASIAAMSAARTPCRSSSRMAATVVPPGLETASRSCTGCSPESRIITAAPERGLHDEVGGQRARQAEQDAGVDHRLDEVEEVRRPAARQRRDGVLLRLRHPPHLAHGREQRLGLVQVLLPRVRARRQHAHALVHQRRGVRHDPDDGRRRRAGRPRSAPSARPRRPRRPGARRRPRRRAGPAACRCPAASPPGAGRGPGRRRRRGRAAGTPYRSASTAARSGLRSQTTSPSGPPRRTSPDSSASPIFPPPMMARPRRPSAVMPGRPGGADERGRGPAARGDGDADGVAAGHQPVLLVGQDSVRHDVLPAVGGPAVPGRPFSGDRDQPLVGGGDLGMTVAGHQDVQAADEGEVGGAPAALGRAAPRRRGERAAARLGVGARPRARSTVAPGRSAGLATGQPGGSARRRPAGVLGRQRQLAVGREPGGVDLARSGSRAPPRRRPRGPARARARPVVRR